MIILLVLPAVMAFYTPNSASKDRYSVRRIPDDIIDKSLDGMEFYKHIFHLAACEVDIFLFQSLYLQSLAEF